MTRAGAGDARSPYGGARHRWRRRDRAAPLAALVLLAAAVAAVRTPAAAALDDPSAAPTAAALSPEAVRALDAVLACARDDGGWTYVCDPPGGRHGGLTRIVIRATQLADLLGLADWDLLVLRSPGTPAAGLLLLDGFRRSGDERYLAAARKAGDMLLATQLSSGGWASEMPVYGRQLARWFRWLNRWTALDDDVTPGAARFLLELWQTTGETDYRAAAERALALLVAAQLPDGGWPLTWREPRILNTLWPSFEDLPSTNDAATSAPIAALLAGARLLGQPDLRAVAQRGGDWLLRVQGPPRQAAWAQQYQSDGTPAPGRRFEPAGYATWESREMLDALLALARASGDQRYCAAVPGAVEWFVRSALAPGCWARLYAPGDNHPLYTALDGSLVASPEEAKRPYRWTGDYAIPALLAVLGLDVRGALRDPAAPFPPQRIPGDPGACPGSADIGWPIQDKPNPRQLIAEAAVLLRADDVPPISPCAALLHR